VDRLRLALYDQRFNQISSHLLTQLADQNGIANACARTFSRAAAKKITGGIQAQSLTISRSPPALGSMASVITVAAICDCSVPVNP
jgi:hypothetical protein